LGESNDDMKLIGTRTLDESRLSPVVAPAETQTAGKLVGQIL
jgi:hypothetical protein